MSRPDMGEDYQSKALGGDTNANVGDVGTSTGVAATTLTDSGKSWTTDQWKGKIVASGNRYGVVRSNTGTVLTIDQWYDATSTSGGAGSSPATGAYVIIGAMFPARWMGVSTDVSALGGTETSLASELTGSGWDRRFCTWAHTAGVNSYTLTTTFTSADGSTRVIGKMGLFSSKVVDAGNSLMLFITLVSPTATMVSGDTLTLTETVTI